MSENYRVQCPHGDLCIGVHGWRVSLCSKTCLMCTVQMAQQQQVRTPPPALPPPPPPLPQQAPQPLPQNFGAGTTIEAWEREGDRASIHKAPVVQRLGEEEVPKKHMHVYHQYFDAIREVSRTFGRPVRVLEIGVQSGGSIEMWRQYFGGNVQLFGVDIEPECNELADDNFTVFIGDQGDVRFIRSVAEKVQGKLDVIIDDGSHIPNHQVMAFEHLYPLLQPHGVYICEDLPYNYKDSRPTGSFIELVKGLVDQLQVCLCTWLYAWLCT